MHALMYGFGGAGGHSTEGALRLMLMLKQKGYQITRIGEQEGAK